MKFGLPRIRAFLPFAVCAIVILGFCQAPASATVGVTVTFVQNNGSFPNLTASQTAQMSGTIPLTLFQDLSPTFSDIGRTFDYWSTEPSGGGSQFSDGADYDFSNDVTLYAQWLGLNHTVTFYENSNSADDIESYQVADAPAPLTLFDEISPSFSNPNHTFEDWSTTSDGSGAIFEDGAYFDFQVTSGLFAQWSLDQETLDLSPGAGVGVISPLTTGYGQSVILPSGDSLSKIDYSFSGWNTAANGSGIEYSPGSSVVLTANETLYAQWSRKSFTVGFATPGMNETLRSISILAGDALRLQSSSGLTRPGFSFSGWFTGATSGKYVGMGGAFFVPTASTTLYAHWSANKKVSLEFSDNGGTGHIPARVVHAGLVVAIPSGASLHRKGFVFRGWAWNPHAATPSVHIGAKFVVTHDRILYALWRKQLPANTPQVLLGSVGIFAPNSAVVTAAMRHSIAIMAIGIDQHDRTSVLLYGYATSVDSAKGSALLSLQRALAVEKQLNSDLAGLNDVGVTVKASGEGRLTDSSLASFRKVEVFAN